MRPIACAALPALLLVPALSAQETEYRLVHAEKLGGADSAISPDGKWMAFSSRRSGNLDLWLVGVETGELKQLTDSTASDYEPRWHPDGNSIVFTSDRDRKQDIFTVDLQTLAVTQQTRTDGIADYPSFSHDGKEIVFTGGPFGRNPNREVFVKNLATGAVRQVTEGHRLVGSTSFAPDGKRIVYHAYYESYGSEKSDLWIVDAAGGVGTDITHSPKIWNYKAVWSFDGEWITFSSKRDTPNFNVFVIRPDGSGLRAVTQQTGPDFRWPNFTRDGRIAWHATEPQQGRIAAVDVETGAITDVVTSRSFIDRLLPSPDGRWLLYADGWSLRVLDAAEPAKAPRVLARGREPQWSADGTAITYRGNVDGTFYSIPANGGDAVAVTERPASAPAAVASTDGRGKVIAADGALVVEAEGGAARKFADDGRPKSSPVWSPDGKRIFFCQSQDGSVRYYVTVKPVIGP